MEAIHFIHLSDIHYLKNYSKQGIEGLISAKQHPRDNVEKCIQEAKRTRIDFVLITGDLTHEGSVSDYLELKELLIRLLGDIPCIVLPGNHDRRDALCKIFFHKEYTEKLDTVYEFKGLRIITLDSGDSVNGLITDEQLNWLSNVLSDSSSKSTLLALHHTLIDGQNGIACASYDEALIRIIQGSDILGIFCGHTHHNYNSQFAGKLYFTADSIAFSMTEDTDILQFEDHAAYNLVTLQNGVLSAQVKQVIPANDLIASFSSDKLSQLFSNESEELK